MTDAAALQEFTNSLRPGNNGSSSLTGIGWAQVFMSVDRLSRIGKLSLTPVRSCEYRISIAGLLRR
jgi:hypothetical protein